MSAERQRAYRRRKRLGILKIGVEVKREGRARLVDEGRVGAWDEDDRAAVQEAVQQILDRRLNT